MDAGVDVLHVDDEPGFTDLAAQFLERADERIRVTTATSADEALDCLEAGNIDCIVSDYDMSGMNGLEFLDAVRERDPGLPFILFTGKGSEEIASEAISAGVTDYRQKETGTDQYAVLARRVLTAVERYRSRQQLADREERLSLYFEQSPLAVIEWNERFEFVRMNPTAEELLGYDSEELRGESWERIVAETDKEMVATSVEYLLEDEGGYHGVIDNVTSDGETVTCEWHNRVITKNGEVVAVLSQFQDVTDRERRKDQLRQERDRFKTLFENLPVAAVHAQVEDGAAIVRQVNPGFEEAFGYDAAEVVGENLDEFILPPEGPVENLNREVIETGSVSRRVRRRTADGVREFHAELALVDDDGEGTPEGYAIYVDLSETVEARKRFEALFEHAPLMVDIHDDEGTILEANRRLCESTGFDREELVGRKIWDLDADLTPEEATDLWGSMGPGEVRRLERRYRRADGSTFPVETHVVWLDLAEGDRFFVITRDITDRVERERRLERQNERLEEFASLVSHDLRNPISVARGRLELARESEEPGADLDAIEGALGRMERIIENLLVLARESEASETAPVRLDEAVEACWSTVEQGEASLFVETDATIRADEPKLRRLLENLLDNAVTHGGAGVRVTVGALEDGAGFYVEDDGAGFHEDPGAAFESGYSTAEDGTGFGLSIVQRIAEAHGWTVEATEGAAGGARFEVRGVEFAD